MAYFMVLYWHLPKETEDNHRNLRIVGNLAKIHTGYLPASSVSEKACDYEMLFKDQDFILLPAQL
jgi:hypothetical protein